MKTTFIPSVLEKIENKTIRSAISEELESHMLDKRDYYLELGYSEEEAWAKAEEDMGAPDDCAVPLNALHHARRVTPLRITAAVFSLVFLAIALFWSNHFCYGSEHLLAVFHSIGIDFLSCGFIIGFAALLIRAHKRRDKVVAAAVLICLLVYFAIAMVKSQTQSPLGLFQPAVYAAFTLLTKGFEGYAGRVFAYQYTPWDAKPAFAISAVIIFAVLLLWAATVFLGIYLQERMCPTGHLRRGVKVFQTAAGILLCADLLLMASGTVAAVLSLQEKQNTAREERRELIELVCRQPGDIPDVLAKENYQPYLKADALPQQYFNADLLTNNTLLSASFDDTFTSDMPEMGGMGIFGFSVTDFESDLTLLNRDTRVTDRELAQITDEGSASLEELLQTDWFANAVSVTRQAGGYPNEGIIQFVFLTENGNTQSIAFYPVQKDGKTVWMSLGVNKNDFTVQEGISHDYQ